MARTTTRKTARKATAKPATTGKTVKITAETRALMGKVADSRNAVTAWYLDRDNVDIANALALVSVAVRIKSAKYGEAWNVAKDLGIRNTSDMSRITSAWTAALAFASRNGITAQDAFGTFLAMSRNVSGTDMADIARNSASLEAATKTGITKRKAQDAKRKATRAARTGNGTQDATGTSKASDGKTGNAHGGTGDTSAAKNGDTGDTVGDTLAASIKSVARRVSDAADSGTLSKADMAELNRMEAAILKARKAFGGKPADATATATAKA